MARAIWTGVISFGLVSVPVGFYSATAGLSPGRVPEPSRHAVASHHLARQPK
jgi:hypothetical protein